MFDIQSISSVAPLNDIVAGLVIVSIAILIANLAVIPKLMSPNKQSAKAMLTVTALGCVSAVSVLAIWPSRLYIVLLIYAVLFILVGLTVSWRSSERVNITARVLGGSVCILLGWALATFITFAPR